MDRRKCQIACVRTVLGERKCVLISGKSLERGVATDLASCIENIQYSRMIVNDYLLLIGIFCSTEKILVTAEVPQR